MPLVNVQRDQGRATYLETDTAVQGTNNKGLNEGVCSGDEEAAGFQKDLRDRIGSIW